MLSATIVVKHSGRVAYMHVPNCKLEVKNLCEEPRSLPTIALIFWFDLFRLASLRSLSEATGLPLYMTFVDFPCTDLIPMPSRAAAIPFLGIFLFHPHFLNWYLDCVSLLMIRTNSAGTFSHQPSIKGEIFFHKQYKLL